MTQRTLIAAVLVAAAVVPRAGAQEGGDWMTLKPVANWFHLSQTRVTPTVDPFLTCVVGQNGEYAIGSRGRGLFRFATATRRFEPFPGGERFLGEHLTCLALGQAPGELFVGTLFAGLHHRLSDGRWEAFTVTDGLPANHVTSLVRDRTGYWVATDAGCARFEGGAVRPAGLELRASSLAFDPRSGRTYAGHTQSRLSVFDPTRGAWSTLALAIEPPATVAHLLVEPSGDLLVGTFIGLFRVNGQSGVLTPFKNPRTREGGEGRLVSCLAVGDDGKSYAAFFGHDFGVYEVLQAELVPMFQAFDGFSETSGLVRAAAGDWLLLSFGRLWHFTDRFLKDGTLVPADYRGAPKTDPMVLEAHALPADGEPFRGAFPAAATVAGGGDREVAGLPRPVGALAAPLPAPSVAPTPQQVVAAAPPAPPAPVRSVLAGESVLTVAETVSRLWIGTATGNLYSMTSDGQVVRHRQFAGPVSRVFFAASGRLYVAAERTALYEFNGFAFRLLVQAPDEVTAVADAPGGEVYVGTRGGLFRTEAGRLAPVPLGAGALPDRQVNALLSQGDSLWIGTRAGLARLAGGVLTTYGAAEGLPSSEVLSLALFGPVVAVGTAGGLALQEGGRFAPSAGSPAPALAVAGPTLWVAQGDLLASFREGRWAGSMGGVGGRVLAVAVVAGSVAVGTESGLVLVPPGGTR